MRRAVINGRFLSQAITGVQRYAREATRALDDLVANDASVARRWTFEVVAPPDATLDLPLHHIAVRRAGRRLRGHAWEQTTLPRHVGPDGALLSFGSTGPLAVRRQAVFIHDASVWAIPETFSREFRWWYRTLLPMLGRRALHIGTVSEFSRTELVERVGVPAAKMLVIPPGSEHSLAARPDHAGLERLAIPERPFVLAVGSDVPHKQFSVIATAMEQAECAGIELLIVGDGAGRTHARRRPAPSRGRRLGRVTDGELRALYERAVCLAFPSTYEGFGLPPLEAMASGCPVVVARAGALPEVCQDAALYCAPGDAAGLARQIGALAADAELRATMIGRGKRRAGEFTWRATARRVVAALDSIDAMHPRGAP